jgi:hypothetical protein
MGSPSHSDAERDLIRVCQIIGLIPCRRKRAQCDLIRLRRRKRKSVGLFLAQDSILTDRKQKKDGYQCPRCLSHRGSA